MKTLYIDISVPRIALTRLLGRLWRGAYFASTAPLHLSEIPDPELPVGWVRVRNRMCGICGSDLHQLFVDAALDVAPVALPAHKRIYLGHEMVGDVVEVGGGGASFQIGDRVVRWGRADDCRARGYEPLCPACAVGHRVLCWRASDPRDHYPVGGGFSDSFITPGSTLVRVPDGLRDEQAIFAEPLAVAIHAAVRAQPLGGERIMVLGVGTIGFLLLQVLRLLEPSLEITALAQYPWQAELASDLGAAHTILTTENTYQAVAEITGAALHEGQPGNCMLSGGFDAVIDCVGIPQTLTDALRWSRAKGRVVLVGVNLHRMKVDLTPVWHQEVDLIGAVGHDVVFWQEEPISTFDLAMRWMGAGQIETARLLTHRYPLTEYRQAFVTALDKQEARSIKVAFTIGQNESQP